MTGTDSHARPSFTTWRYTTTSPVDHMRATLRSECEDSVSGKLGIPPLPRRLVQHHRGGHRAVRGQDDAGRPGARSGARHCAEIPRIGDLVEADEQRRLDDGQLPRVGVAEGLAPRDQPLVVAGLRDVGELLLLAHLDTRARADEPILRLGGAVGRPDLEHLPPPSHGLADGVAPGDAVPDHRAWPPTRLYPRPPANAPP